MIEPAKWDERSIEGCPETETIELLSEWMQLQVTIETFDSLDGYVVGFTDLGTSPVTPIARLANSGSCLREALVEGAGKVSEFESFAGPVVEGIDVSSIIAFVEDDVHLQFVFASTGDRVVHVLLSARDEPRSEQEIEQQLNSIVQKAEDAAARVDECGALHTQQFDVITDQRCDGFESWSPELLLEPFDKVLSGIDSTTQVSYYGSYASSELLLLPDDLAVGAGGTMGETNVPADLTACTSELGDVADTAAQFDQWLQVQSRLDNPASGVDVFHTVGVAPNSDAAANAVRAYAKFDECASFVESLGARSFRSELMTDLPEGVVEGMFWTIEDDDSTTIVADFAFDNGVVTSISLTSSNAEIDAVRDLLDIVVSRLPLYDARVAAEELPEVERD